MTLAHITLEIPFVALVVRARLAGLDPALSEASRDLGATGCQTFRHVTLPLIWPGILAGGMLAFTLSLDDFVVSFFTTGPGATTLPILIYSSVKRGITPEINALSTLLVMASVVATTAIMALQNRRDNSSAEHPEPENRSWGAHPPGCRWTAPRVQPSWRRTASQTFELFGALGVFRGDAENRTRGACAPISTSEFRVEFSLRARRRQNPKSFFRV
jgi:hypothetical protein